MLVDLYNCCIVVPMCSCVCNCLACRHCKLDKVFSPLGITYMGLEHFGLVDVMLVLFIFLISDAMLVL